MSLIDDLEHFQQNIPKLAIHQVLKCFQGIVDGTYDLHLFGVSHWDTEANINMNLYILNNGRGLLKIYY